MDIRIDRDTFICSDRYSVWISKVYMSKKTGKEEKRRVSGYYQSLNGAVCSYINQKVNSSEAMTLKEFNSEIEVLKQEVKGWEKAIKAGDNDG